MRWGAVAAAMLALAASGCDRVLSVDEPPDLLPIVSDYRQPSGTLAEADLTSLAAAVEVTFEATSRSESFRFVDSVVDAMMPSASDLDIDGDAGADELSVQPLDRADLVATIEAEYRCRGSGHEDEDRGQVSLLGAVDRDGLFPGIWGEVRGCRFSVGELPVQLDGRLAIWVDAGRSRIRASDLGRAPLVLVFDGTSTVDGTFDLEIDARRTRTRRLLYEGSSLELESQVVESRIVLDGRVYVIGFVDTQFAAFLPRTLSFIVRASDGLWACTSLVGASVGACENQSTGGRVTW